MKKTLDLLDFSKQYIWSCGKIEIKPILEKFEKKSIVKKNQLNAILLYLDTYKYIKSGQNISSDIREIRKDCYEILNKEKHDNIELDKEVIKATNDIHKIKSLKIKILKDTEEKDKFKKILKTERKKIVESKEKTYDKTLSLEHKLKMRVSNIGLNRMLKDGEIKDIKQMKNEGKTYKENMSSEEYKIYLATINSISKRKLDVPTMIDILLLRNKTFMNEKGQTKTWFPLTIVKHFQEKDVDNVTIDIIKNIWYGKTKLYKNEHFDDFEGQKITYEEYLDLIKTQ